MQQYASKINDGHTSLLQDYTNSLIYPINYQKVGDSYYLYTTDKEYEAHLGKQIVEINNRPTAEVVQSFRSMLSCDNEERFAQQLKNQVALYDFWIDNPYKSQDSTLLLTFGDNSKIGLKAVAKKSLRLVQMQHEKPTVSIRQPSKYPFLYQMLAEQKICYLQFQSCADQSSERMRLMENRGNMSDEQMEKYLARIPRFDSFLSTMFNEIQTNGIETLVIDVRGNGGGNEMLCFMLMSWLKPVDQIKEGGASIRFSSLWEKSNPQLSSMFKQQFQESNIPYELGKLYNGEWLSGLFQSADGESKGEYIGMDTLFARNMDTTKIFKGTVVFIQNESTYSSAGQLITSAIDNNIGSVIGTNGTYKSCSYGDILPFQLPNSGLKGFVSHKVFQRPDSAKCGEASITPVTEIEVDWHDFVSGNDVYWSWILSKYAK